MESATFSRIATVKRVFELFNGLPMDAAARRASPVTAELLDLFTIDVEFSQPALQPEGAQLFKGREELREGWEHFPGREGVELEQKGGSIFTFDGERNPRFEAFFDHETARREFDAL